PILTHATFRLVQTDEIQCMISQFLFTSYLLYDIRIYPDFYNHPDVASVILRKDPDIRIIRGYPTFKSNGSEHYVGRLKSNAKMPLFQKLML
ncbi:MAG TPA: hypothetical protein VFV08_12560, partial [Puia sp.]|nr:hypothetical protein [Puia sp.]